MTSIFISHSSKDNAWARKLKVWLEAEPRGHRSLFLDFDREAGLKAGDLWEQQLYAKLRQCQAVLALVSRNWLESRWCFAEAVQAREKGKRLILARIDDADTSSLFRDAQHLDVVSDEADALARLETALADVFDIQPSREPYPGLVPFDELDAGVFVGRDPEIVALLEMLESMRLKSRSGERLLLLLGASGSGKSSLVRAGVLPRLRRLPERWQVLPPMRPGLDPVRELARSLATALRQEQLGPVGDRLTAPDAGSAGPFLDLIDEFLLQSRHAGATALLILDQMEELLGLSGAQARSRFLDLLRRALEHGDGRLLMLATLRSEYLGEVQILPFLTTPLPLPYREQTLDPVPLDRLEALIREPGRRWPAVVEFEDRLVERMVQDTGTRDALPLLAFTLNRLWRDTAARSDGVFRLEEYERLGGLEGSVRTAADEALALHRRTPGELEALRAAFVPSLVRVDAEGVRTRRRAFIADLTPATRTLLKPFVDLGLLVTNRDPEGRETIEVAHEALLRTWPQLDRWLAEDQDALRLLDGLERAARDWGEGEHSPDLLAHRGSRLAEMQMLLSQARFGQVIGGMEKRYIEACALAEAEREEREREERERRVRDAEQIAKVQRRIALGSLFALLVVFILAAIAWSQWHRSERQAVAAEAQASGLTALEHFDAARGLEGLLEAVRAGKALQTLVENDDSFGTYPALSPMLALQVILDNIYEKNRTILQRSSSSSSVLESRPAAYTDCSIELEAGSSKLVSSIANDQLAAVMGHQRMIMAKACSPDGKYIVTAGADLTVRLRATTSSDPAIVIGLHGGVSSISFTPDSRKFMTENVWDTVVSWELPFANMLQHMTALPGGRETVQSARFSPSGQTLVTSTRDGTVRLWSAGGQPEAQPIRTGRSIILADFTADDGHIITVDATGETRIIDVLGQSRQTFPGQGTVIYAALSPDRTHIGLALAGGGIEIVDLATGKRSRIGTGHRGWILGLDFTPDGKRIVTAGADDTIRFWDLAGQSTGNPLVAGQGQVLAVGFSPRGDLIVSAGDDGTVKLWTAAGEAAGQLIGHRGKVLGVGFSPDGTLIATSGADGTFRLWLPSGANLARYLGYHGPLALEASGGDFGTPSIDFSPDQHSVAVPGNHGIVRIWRIQALSELLQRACDWLADYLTTHPSAPRTCD